SSFAGDQDAAEHPGAWSLAGELVELRLAVEGEQPDAALIGESDVALFLYCIAEGEPVGRCAVREAQRDLRRARDIEPRSLAGQHRDDLRRRVRLHRVIDARDRQIPGQEIIGLTDDIEIDD